MNLPEPQMTTRAEAVERALADPVVGAGIELETTPEDLVQFQKRGDDAGRLARDFAKIQHELIAWERAAKATDIYSYLQDALSRMGTVGPRGIREMVAYCAKIESEIARLRPLADEAGRLRDLAVAWECARRKFIADADALPKGSMATSSLVPLADAENALAVFVRALAPAPSPETKP